MFGTQIKICLIKLDNNATTMFKAQNGNNDITSLVLPDLKMVDFIGQGPPMRPFGRHVKQPITFCFIQRHLSGRGNVTTIIDQCVKLSDVF